MKSKYFEKITHHEQFFFFLIRDAVVKLKIEQKCTFKFRKLDDVFFHWEVFIRAVFFLWLISFDSFFGLFTFYIWTDVNLL